MDKSKITAIKFEDVDTSDYPAFCDAYISAAELDGVEMTEDELIELNEDSDFVYNKLMQKYFLMVTQHMIDRLAIKNGIKIMSEKKVLQVIAKMSAKRKEVNKEYNKIKKEMLTKDDRCKIKSPECTGKAQGLDHRQKRSPSNLIKIDNLLAACNACNLYKEVNPIWATNNGFSISRFKK